MCLLFCFSHCNNSNISSFDSPLTLDINPYHRGTLFTIEGLPAPPLSNHRRNCLENFKLSYSLCNITVSKWVVEIQLKFLPVTKSGWSSWQCCLKKSYKHCSSPICMTSKHLEVHVMKSFKLIARSFQWVSIPLHFLQHYLQYILLV